MGKNIKIRLVILLLIIVTLTGTIFSALILYNNNVTKETASEFSSIYMSEMMCQMQDHFRSIIMMKNKEVQHIVEHPIKANQENPREALMENAENFEFDYVALYDDNGNYETIMGESAWYRNLNEFMGNVKSGKAATTTGYLTSSGEKYLVFGVPAEYDMLGGGRSSVLLLGFNVEKLYDYIHIEKTDSYGYDASLDIILTNGSYVLHHKDIVKTSYFDHIMQYGSFVGRETNDGVGEIEKAMAGGKEFSHTVTLNGSTKHIYGAASGGPDDWYFILSMPQGATDALLSSQNTVKLKAFITAAVGIFILFLLLFLFYLSISLKLIKETERARNKAEVANNAKSTFLSNMSHDIRTPMNAIVGFTNLALKEKGIPQSIESYLSKIKSSSNHLLMLINEVLEMSKIESGKIELDETPSKITNSFESLCAILEEKAYEKKQKFNINIDVEDDCVYVDVVRLTQLMQNIIANAIKYTPEGGEVSVLVKQKPCDEDGYGLYEFVVADNGIGMSKEFSKKVFEPFERERREAAENIEGTGLGLSIVKHIADVMGGNITLDTEIGEGTTFTVCLKFRIADSETAENSGKKNSTVNARADIDSLTSRFAGKRILLAEDNEFNREIATAILTGAGFEVETAQSGADALEKIKINEENYFDLVLMDVQMPVMTGYEATKAIRALGGRRSEIKIIAVTANAFESDRREAKAAGMDAHVAKPIDIENLYSVLEKIL